MKILYISSENVPGNTGGSVRTLELAKSLKKLGHSVTIFTNRDAKQKRREIIDGVRIIRSKIKFRKTLPLLGIKRFDILDKDFDAVIERYSIFGGLGTIYSKLHGAPLLLEVHAPHLEEAEAAKMIKGRLILHAARKWRELQFRTAEKIITTKKALVGSYENKFVKMPLGGVDPSLFNAKLRNSAKSKSIRKFYDIEGKFVIVFHGAFARWHGITDLMNAAKIVKKKDAKITFLLIGSGELEKKAKSMASNNCIFAGKKDHKEMPYYLAACDAGVAPYGILPKHLHGIGFYWTPVKVFEYMASGLPIVAAGYEDLKEIIGNNGLFYKPGDCKALANAITKVKKFRAAQNSVLRARKYSWDNQASQIEKVLMDTL